MNRICQIRNGSRTDLHKLPSLINEVEKSLAEKLQRYDTLTASLTGPTFSYSRRKGWVFRFCEDDPRLYVGHFA